MDTSHDLLGLSTGKLNLVGETRLADLSATGWGEDQTPINRLSVKQPMSSTLPSPSSNLFKRCTKARRMDDMDLDLSDDAQVEGSLKLALTDSFINYRQVDSNRMGSSSIVSSPLSRNSLVSDGGLSFSPTNSTTSDRALFCDEIKFTSPPRRAKNEYLISCSQYSGRNSQAMSLLQEACSQSSSGAAFPFSFGAEIVNKMRFHDLDTRAAACSFTVTQFRELQHQALIFKYMMSGIHVPAELIIPLRNNLFGQANMTTNIGWRNNYHNFATNTDPEPGRCRRTDGKKWRCAREAVPDQKYCERHMHRGRHRGRKLVQGQPASSAASRVGTGSSSATVAFVSLGVSCCDTVKRIIPSIPLNSTAKSYVGTNAPLDGSCFQLPLQSGASSLCTKDYRYLNEVGKSDIDLRSEHTFLTQRPGSTGELAQQVRSTVGLSVPYPAGNSMHSTKLQHSFSGSTLDGQDAALVHSEPDGQPLKRFFDDLPRARDPSMVSWFDIEEERVNPSSSKRQLSIAVSMASSDFNLAIPNSPRDKLLLSPLKLSISTAGEEDPTHMALAVDSMDVGMNDETRRQTNWIPIVWETSPLAEVLQSRTPMDSKVSGSGLDLMTHECQNSPRESPRTSPTAVLQKATFVSSSDSSSGNSPRSTIKTEG